MLTITRRRPRRLLSLLALVAVLGAGAACSGSSSGTTVAAGSPEQPTGTGSSGGAGGSPKLVIVTTVAPITSIASAVVGDLATVSGIVPEGTNSHTFEPPPSAAEVLSEADLVFLNGLQLEEPTKDLAEANRKEGSEIVELGTATITEDEYRYDFSFPEEEGKPNPHLWTDPPMVKRYAEIIRDTVIERDPANAAAYRANYDTYAAAIDELDVAMRTSFATVPTEHSLLGLLRFDYVTMTEALGGDASALREVDLSIPTPDTADYPQ